jgi:hypothetical protein
MGRFTNCLLFALWYQLALVVKPGVVPIGTETEVLLEADTAAPEGKARAEVVQPVCRAAVLPVELPKIPPYLAPLFMEI